MAEDNRILIIVTLFSIGGATETVVSLAAGLSAKGFKVDIITGPPLKNEGDMFSTARGLGLNVLVLDSLVRDIHLLNDAISLWKLMRFIKKNKYQIVHTHSSKAGVLGRFAAWLSSTPVIIHTIHGLPYHNFQSKTLTASYIAIEKFCASISTKIICVTRAIVKNCVFNGISTDEKFVVMRSGLNILPFTVDSSNRDVVRSSLGFNPDDIVGAVISRIAPLKGHEYIIMLAKRTKLVFPHMKYLIVGDGETGDQFRNSVIENDLSSQIFFTGMIQPDEIPKMINAIDFVVHPSLREGLARVLPQAIIMGKKVITFALDGVDEVIEDGISGYTVEIGNVDKLFESSVAMMREGVGTGVSEIFRARVREEFSSDTMVRLHADLYLSLLPK